MKEYLTHGSILLIVSSFFLLFSSCSEEPEDKNGLHIYKGINNGSYFELNLKLEEDSVYSFIADEYIGALPGYSNSILSFEENGFLDKNNRKLKFKTLNKNKAKLFLEDKEFTLHLDTVTYDRDYLLSDQYSIDYDKRMKAYRNAYIK